MRVFLVGVSCVGKTTIGQLLAKRLGYPSFDLDEEIEKHFETSIKRLKSRFLTDYSFRKEAAVVLKNLAENNSDCVIALPPSGLRDAFLRVIKKFERVTVAIEDTPDNIVKRITFYDIDSHRVEKVLSEKDREYCRNEIKKDMTYQRKSYQRADLYVDIADLDAEASAAKIEKLLVKKGGAGRTN
jgi:shikimate kinase